MLWKKILIGVVGILVLFVVVVATRPSAYHVERKREIAARANLVFGVLNDLHQFAGVLVLFGSPWEKADPDMQKTFEGPAAGVGQSLAWSGTMDVGTGKMTIEESVPGQKVVIRLEFVKPMKSTALYSLALVDTPNGSSLTWAMDGNHNFIGKAFGMFVDMDKMLGADVEMGLAQVALAAAGSAGNATKTDLPAE
jgi:hypothetical protein